MSRDVARLLGSLGLAQYAEVFTRNDIDFEVLRELADDDLKELGLTLGHRRKLLKAIAALPADAATSGGIAERTSDPERRHLTLMFVDLVSSTALSQRLDPEDLRDVLQRYQDAVSGAVSGLDGYVAKFMGDGVLVYFGYPRAHEDDAERAIRAARAIIAAVASLSFPGIDPLRVRIGIATGPVVVGERAGEGGTQEQAVTGEAPNLAARLQALADPGQILIDPGTYRLIGNVFDVEDLGPRAVKGFAEPVAVWSVTGERDVESRFDATHAPTFSRLIGREHEFALLRERWELAKDGEGQVVLLSGEAGIGKSRLLQAFREEIATEPHFRLRYQCSPQHGNSAFYPVIRQLERAAGYSATDSPTVKLDKLEAVLRLSQPDAAGVLPLFAGLLSLPCADRYGALDLPPEQRRERTVEAMIDQVFTLSRMRPVLVLLEDAHWIDPSTESFMWEVVARAVDARVFVVVTHREGRLPASNRYPHVVSIALNRLSRKQCVEFVRAAGGQDLPTPVVERLIARADGVPLYVEELTKSLVHVRGSGGAEADAAEIPATLQALLIARLDRLGAAKLTAQVGSVIGREFSYRLLTAVADAPEAEINGNLDRLLESQLMYRKGGAPDATYTFKHALVQDTAYETLLLRRRQHLHARVAAILERDFPEVMQAEPETLAHHYSRAGNAEQAVRYFVLFAEKTAGIYAHAEALAILQEAQAYAERLDGPRRDRILLELALRRAESLHFLGRRVEIVELLLAHEERLDRLADHSLAGQYYFWLGFAHGWLGHRADAARHLRKSLEEATRCGDEAVMGRAHRALATEALYSGKPLHEAIVHAREAAALLVRAHDAFWLGQALFTLGYLCIFAGELDSALDAAGRLDALGASTRIRRTQTNAAMIAGFARAVRGEGRSAIELCERAVQLAPDDFETSFALVCVGRACCEAGDLARAIPALEQGVQLARRVRSVQFCAWFTIMLGEAYFLNGEHDRAATTVGGALEASEGVEFRFGVGLCEHLMGRIAAAGGDRLGAKRRLERALACFTSLGARFEQARVLLDLAASHAAEDAREAAAANVALARDLFDTVGAPQYLQRAAGAEVADGAPVRPKKGKAGRGRGPVRSTRRR